MTEMVRKIVKTHFSADADYSFLPEYQNKMLDLFNKKANTGDFKYLSTGWYRSLMFDRYPGSPYYPVDYDHLYRIYYGISIYSTYERYGSNIYVLQGERGITDIVNLLELLFNAIFWGISLLVGLISALIGVIMSVLVAVLGLAVGFLLNVLRDETSN
ncbi:hypothetical protein LCGC14_2964050, partial [marine sediment metagenome]